MRRINFCKELSLLSLFFLPVQDQAKLLYWALSDRNSFCDEKLYMNLGYWKHAPKNLDEAGDHMAQLLAEVAALNNQDSVLDVGSGFGDQDIYWMKRFNPKKIIGVNVCQQQITVASDKVKQEKLENHIRFMKANANELPFDDASFDVVFSLEAPFHFNTREKFLREAFRVLKPGGRLVSTDLTTSHLTSNLKNKLMQHLGCNFWQVPKANRYDIATYQEKMIKLGFSKVNIHSIWNDVYPPWLEFIKSRIHSEAIKNRFSFIFRYFLLLSLSAKKQNRQQLLDYALVYGQKM